MFAEPANGAAFVKPALLVDADLGRNELHRAGCAFIHATIWPAPGAS